MSITTDILKYINTNKPFAFIKLPRDNSTYFLVEDGTGSNLYSFTSFDTLKKYELKFSTFKEITATELEKIKIPLSFKEKRSCISKEEYLRLVQKTINSLENKKADKIVISREKWTDIIEINPIRSFRFLCEKYPNSFCNLTYWNSEEIWLGATPELLGSWGDSVFKTVALAGTLPDKESYTWGEKESKEQQYVTDYIQKKLKNYSSNISVIGPETLHLGHVKHLITYFSTKLDNSNLLSHLIESLHPTPAVCGIPLEESRTFILKEEGYNRDFYAGYIGIEMPDSKNYFVNLRCSKLYSTGALLFIGGGITSESNAEKEWEETELKAKFIEDCLQELQ